MEKQHNFNSALLDKASSFLGKSKKPLPPRLLTFRAILSHCLLPFLFVVFVLLKRPIHYMFEFDTDEGINLIKAALYAQGFSLYTEVWNDQPPILTVLLSFWFHLFGQSLLAGRILVLSLATLLVWSFQQTLRIFLGTWPAFLGTLLLINSNRFSHLSAAVMIGLPSLAFAMLSIYSLVVYKQKNKSLVLVFLSGTLLALSLQTKVFTVFLLPIAAVYLWGSHNQFFHWRKQEYRQLKVLGLWFLCFSVVYLFLGLSLHSINYEQLIEAHLSSNVKDQFANTNNISILYQLAFQDKYTIFLAIFGIISMYKYKQWHGVLPLLWLGTGTLLLLNHKPLWPHHYTLLAIPLCWLAAYGIYPIGEFLRDRRWRSVIHQHRLKQIFQVFPVALSALLLSLSLTGFSQSISSILQRRSQPNRNYHELQVIQLLKSQPSTQWLFTDRPIYGIHSGLRVPPEIAVFSLKRLRSGNLNSQTLIQVLDVYKPEQLVLSRFKKKILQDQQIRAYIQQHYVKVYSSQKVDLYRRQPQ